MGRGTERERERRKEVEERVSDGYVKSGIKRRILFPHCDNFLVFETLGDLIESFFVHPRSNLCFD